MSDSNDFVLPDLSDFLDDSDQNKHNSENNVNNNLNAHNNSVVRDSNEEISHNTEDKNDYDDLSLPNINDFQNENNQSISHQIDDDAINGGFYYEDDDDSIDYNDNTDHNELTSHQENVFNDDFYEEDNIVSNIDEDDDEYFDDSNIDEGQDSVEPSSFYREIEDPFNIDDEWGDEEEDVEEESLKNYSEIDEENNEDEKNLEEKNLKGSTRVKSVSGMKEKLSLLKEQIKSELKGEDVGSVKSLEENSINDEEEELNNDEEEDEEAEELEPLLDEDGDPILDENGEMQMQPIPKNAKKGNKKSNKNIKVPSIVKKIWNPIHRLYSRIIDLLYNLITGLLNFLGKLPIIGKPFQIIAGFSQWIRLFCDFIPLILILFLMHSMNTGAVAKTETIDFPDDGALTLSKMHYHSENVTAQASNNGEITLRGNYNFNVYSSSIINPLTWFSPEKVLTCKTNIISLDSGETKSINIKCGNASGLFKKVSVDFNNAQ